MEEKLKIRSMRSTEKTLIIETENEVDADKILNHNLLRKGKLLIERSRKRNPPVIIYDVSADTAEEETLAGIYHQNFEDLMPFENFKNECRVRFRTGLRNKPTVHFVLEMSVRLRQTTITRGKLYVGFASHTAKDYVVVP